MTKRSHKPLDDEGLLELVRHADPLAGANVEPDQEEAMLERLLSAVRQSPSRKRRLAPRRRALLIAVAVFALGAIGVGVALGSGVLSGGEKKVLEFGKATSSKKFLKNLARYRLSSSPISDLKVVAASQNGNVGVLQGTQDGEPVCLVEIGGAGALWSPITSYLDHRDLAVQSGASGGSSSDLANKAMLAGIASARVARVDLVSRDGTVRAVELEPMALGAKAFALEFDPTVVHPKVLMAYDEDGNFVASWGSEDGLLASMDQHQSFCGRPGDMSCLQSSNDTKNKSKSR
jgi:hypothetical protein